VHGRDALHHDGGEGGSGKRPLEVRGDTERSDKRERHATDSRISAIDGAGSGSGKMPLENRGGNDGGGKQMKRAPVSLGKHTDLNTGRESLGNHSARFLDGAVCKDCQFERALCEPTVTSGLMYAPVTRARVLTGMHPARATHSCTDHCVLHPYRYV